MSLDGMIQLADLDLERLIAKRLGDAYSPRTTRWEDHQPRLFAEEGSTGVI
jgi:hypothetical protein